MVATVTKEFVVKMSALDDAAERAGGYVALPTAESNTVGYDYPALIKYCKKHNLEPSHLSKQELARFQTRS